MPLALRLKEYARELGFDLVGIAAPDHLPHAAFYRDWLAAGFHGQMHYLSTERAVERRSDPRVILPECKAIVVVGVNYWFPSPPFPLSLGERGKGGKGVTGCVARYAWGADYHDVLPRKMRELVAFVESEVGHAVEHRIYTDTGPLLERDLAQRAGLGWIGKNTMLINPRIGSWTLLGEILLDLDLEPDAPFEADRCGSCTRCLDACPTDAILDGRILDARRCISYLTIELKGEMPEDLRSKVGDWVFGCDICQEVCPWNSKIQTPKSKPQSATLALDELLAMTEEEFRERFGDTPLARPKRRGLMRNAAVVTGNQSSVFRPRSSD